MSFAEVDQFDAHQCNFHNAGRNLYNISVQVVLPPPSVTSSPTEPPTRHLQDSESSLATLPHTYPPHSQTLHRDLITAFAPLLGLDFAIPKRDFLRDLPNILALHTLSFVDDPRTLVRVSQVNKHWRSLLSDRRIWQGACVTFGFDADKVEAVAQALLITVDGDRERSSDVIDPALVWLTTLRYPQLRATTVLPTDRAETEFSFRRYLRSYYDTSGLNWWRAMRLARPQLLAGVPQEHGGNAVTLDKDWVVLGTSHSGKMVKDTG